MKDDTAMQTIAASLDRVTSGLSQNLSTAPSQLATMPSANPNMPSRLDDAALAQVRAIVASPLLPPEPAGDEHVTKTVRFLLANLSCRNSDELSGKLLLAAYQRKLASYPKDQISYLCEQALERCKWFPTIAECLEIMAGWQRNDEALRNRQRAEVAMRNELQARLDETLKRIDAGEVSQDEVNALPEQWRRIAETRGLLRLNKDKTYTLRQRRAVAQIPSNAPARCGGCQGVGRVMTLDGGEADCSCVEKQEMAA